MPAAPPSSSVPPALAEPAAVLAVYLRDRDVHPYGIADVEQLWDLSRWWLDGDAAVGVMDLPGSPVPVLYAVAARHPERTLALLTSLEDAGVLPERFVITGPLGLTSHLAASRRAVWSKRYTKFALRHTELLPPEDPKVLTLGRDHLDALGRLYATDAAAGDFFHPGLVDTGYYLGVGEGHELLATAGIHVIDRANGVAAIGNVATHPDRRGRGLARRVTATLCRRLLVEVPTIGLNVTLGNHAATGLYDGLGFVPVLPYEEAELARV